MAAKRNSQRGHWCTRGTTASPPGAEATAGGPGASGRRTCDGGAMTSATIAIGDRTVDRLGFGAMRVMGADDPIALIRRAVDGGVTFIDTADIYGMGES